MAVVDVEVEELKIALPSKMAAAVRDAVADGDYSSESEVVRAALRDWTARRAGQTQDLAALKADIAEGLADIDAGRIKDFDVDEIVAKGRMRLAGR